MKGWLENNKNSFIAFLGCENIYLDTNFMNLGQITHMLWLIPIASLFTPIYPNFGYQYQEDLIGLLICSSMLLKQHTLKFSACYEFVQGHYLIPLDYICSTWWQHLEIKYIYLNIYKPSILLEIVTKRSLNRICKGYQKTNWHNINMAKSEF